MSNIGNKETFSRNLRYYVEHSGKNQKMIAEDIGINRSVMNEWIKGKKYPRIDKIEILADYFGIKKSDLIEEKGVEEMTKDAGMHARILMDKELLDVISIYYSLSERDQKIVRSFVKSFDE